MAYTFRLPDLGEGVAEGEIARWLVAVGDTIAEDDPLLEVETDKTTVEIPSPAAGTVSAILVQAGAVVPVGTDLVVIGDGAAPAAAPSAGPAAAEARAQATPAVRKLAADAGVDLETVTGTGPGGRITPDDVERAGAGGVVPAGRRVPLDSVRRAIGERLGRSQREVPAVTVVEECDFTDLEAARGARSHLAYLIAAAVDGLRAVPELNASLDGREIVLWERFDFGIAVQTERGLTAPVLRAADTLDLDATDAELRRLADGARAGTLAPQELRGATFTVTSAGRLGGLFATPLVSPPEVGILGLHRIAERPAVHEGQIAVRRIGLVSCTFDHRVVDGARASEFLLHVIGQLQAVR